MTEKPPKGFNQSVDEISVERVTPTAIYMVAKPAGSAQTPRQVLSGLDWSRIRDINGKETVVNRPLAFPLTSGKTWDVQFTELNPNRNNKSEQLTVKYTVIGYETIEVAAGTFKALKIEAEGRWVIEKQPGTTVGQGAQTTPSSTTMSTDVQRASEQPVSGRIYKAFWYVPEVRRWAKSVEEVYSSLGVRSERTIQSCSRSSWLKCRQLLTDERNSVSRGDAAVGEGVRTPAVEESKSVPNVTVDLSIPEFGPPGSKLIPPQAREVLTQTELRSDEFTFRKCELTDLLSSQRR